MRFLLAAAIAVALLGTAQATAGLSDAEVIVAYCRKAAPALAGKGVPVEDRTPVGMCVGYISGLADAFQHLCATSHLKGRLPLEQRKGIASVTANPENQSYASLISSFIKFADENPDLLDITPTPLLLQRALQQEFPCNIPKE